MASTIQLQGTMNWATSYVRLAPLSGLGGIIGEPAITIANTVKQFILSPPFSWRWNRNSTTFTTTAGTQDYTVAIADFGWLEKASGTITSQAVELETYLALAVETKQSRPLRISTQSDDNAGNIKFRLSPVPDGTYTITVDYQKKAALFTALTGTWAPIPDEMSYLYSAGFLSSALEMQDDERFPAKQQTFLTLMVSAVNGLSESEKALFLGDKVRDMKTEKADFPAPK